jgi:signal transduction histidine kinase
MLLTRRGSAPKGPLRPAERAPAWARAGWLVAVTGPAAAESSAAGLGPWIFGSVALVLVGAAAYAAGGLRAGLAQGTAARQEPETVERPDDGSQRADQCALRACVDALPGPALVAVAVGRGVGVGTWALRHANAPARQALGMEPAGDLLPWDAVLARLPVALSQALVSPQNPQPTEFDRWQMRRVTLADGAGEVLLLQQPAAPVDVDAGPTESESYMYTVSHDLRAPIRVVDGFTRIVKEDYGRLLDRVGNDHLDRVLGAAARMNHMIDALLTLARLSSLPLARQPVNLTQLATYIIDDLRRAAPEREADIDIQPGLEVTGDPTLLRLVLENLLGNAWKYSARVKRTKIVFGAEMQDGRRVFAVRDNGAGFDMRSADRLFGLFQRLHSATDFPGTGVGLASVQRIVRRHGGEIWADAEPGQGAAFHFTLRG